ncbi:MAG: hypothetical protein ACI9Q4_002494 [Sediminicola sp.]
MNINININRENKEKNPTSVCPENSVYGKTNN